MPVNLPEVHPGIPGLDDLELLRQGLIPRDLVDLGQEPATFVDAEGVPVAELSASGELSWLSPRSSRPYEHWHTGTADVETPVVVVDQLDGLAELPPDTATIAVLASTEATLADQHLVAHARQHAADADAKLIVIPLGTNASRRSEKLAHVVDTFRHLGSVIDHTSVDPALTGPDGVGLVVFFTGLSGSGKSTIARALRHHLIEEYEVPVTLLDGDVVRQHLSRGLTFSIADRDTNVRRIGWVAAEIARHGGIVIASPIAPLDDTRREVRRMVAERGGRFLLVHINTPLEECERRDRKGLYAKARAGLIPDFTGISSPYEAPVDADLRIDTTGVDAAALRDLVLTELTSRGWLAPPRG